MATINELAINYHWKVSKSWHFYECVACLIKQLKSNIFESEMRFFNSLHRTPQPCKWLVGGNRYGL